MSYDSSVSQNQVQPFFEIPYYHDYISPALARNLLAQSKPIANITGLSHVGASGGLETIEALKFLVSLYSSVKSDLALVLKRRISDRKFIDERVKACYEFNQKLGRDIKDSDYKTILGLEDADGRIVIGPKTNQYCEAGGKPIAPIPSYLKGPHVTLFGPPDSAKMAINAMNAYHRKLKGEPTIVEELLATQNYSPKWGADDEDSKTPLRQDLIDASVNLTGCFERSLELREGEKHYKLANDHLSAPLKRFPGLALPATFLFLNENPIPLHLYDFALHVFRNWSNPEALTFYVPKLENEEEARYIHTMIRTTESMIKAIHSEYQLGTIRIMIVLENPRAILRAHEIMDELHPYFVGASLGWHDYLGSTARLFKEDGNYRIPVKADPNIVIKYIKASHSMLADVVGSRGGIKVGGMYGILPQQTEVDSPSFQVTLKGFFKDVITQLKRDLTGYWVAHPDFVRLGLAIVEAWRLYQSGDKTKLFKLTHDIFTEKYRAEVDAFILGADIVGLDKSDPNYVRSLLVADIKESDYIPNNHPDEVRYNVFQSLQYLTDWLCGNGCVALPTIIDGIPVRVMDDLATAERSRWEVWHELYHGRFRIDEFLKIAHEEMNFIRKDLSNEKKIVQVKWDARTEKWYPVAMKLMLQLMTAERPVEFATELLMPFTIESIRNSTDPWAEMIKADPGKFQLKEYISRWCCYFEACGCAEFATQLANNPILDLVAVQTRIMQFSVAEIIEAASYHGDIGESAKSLDRHAKAEQKLVLDDQSKDATQIKTELKSLGAEYLTKFGFKFLVSAKGQTSQQLLEILQKRINNPKSEEVKNAQEALWLITYKRLAAAPKDHSLEQLKKLTDEFGVDCAQIALTDGSSIQDICLGKGSFDSNTLFEIASLSKTLASAFALEFFASREINLNTKVNELFARAGSSFKLCSIENPDWGDLVTVSQLMNHSALNMHYVKGFDVSKLMPNISSIATNPVSFGYEALNVAHEPGTVFKYSGGGFIVLEHLIETLAKESIAKLTGGFFDRLGIHHLTFQQSNLPEHRYAQGVFDDGKPVPGGRLMFPAFAAGAMGTAKSMLSFLSHLGRAYKDVNGSGGISHDTAVQMLHGRDLGCREFMGCDMGLGVFVAEMADNRVAIHQGANEGFRAIYLYVFSGPDEGKGFVILCNADNRGVVFNAKVAQLLLQTLKCSGVNYNSFVQSNGDSFDATKISQEQIVNLGYKQLVFSAFEPMLPEKINRTAPKEPNSEYNLLVTSKVIGSSNQRFARGENLISAYEPEFDPELFGRQGKIMDSWESVRHNSLVCDNLDLELSERKDFQFVRLSTKYHDGNQAEYVRVLGRESSADDWKEILPKVSMTGHAERCIKLASATAAPRFVRIEMYPDGGLTRVGIYSKLVDANEVKKYLSFAESQSLRFEEKIPSTKKPLVISYKPSSEEIARNLKNANVIDYASSAFGGALVRASNEHYGPAVQVISPFPPIHMFDGLESARSRKPGHFEDVELKLAKVIDVKRIVFDFKYFTNNNPKEVSIAAWIDGKWQEVLGVTPVKAFAANQRSFSFKNGFKTDRLWIKTLPDGGVNRIHVYDC